MREVLIVGAGISGASTAERLSSAGMRIHLVERAPRIGGHAAEMGCKAAESCVRCNVCIAAATLRRLAHNPRVSILTSTELVRLEPGHRGKGFVAHLVSTANAAAPRRLSVDAVVVATGHTPFDPSENGAYGYRRIPNVITGMEAERQLADQNCLVRPSDGVVPHRVAFLQCVGSRTEEIYRRPEDTDYCSTVCCSYALRIARRLKHQSPETEITVFHMDIQNFGKDFTAFLGSCGSAMKLVRSRPSDLAAGPGGSVNVTFAPDGATADATAATARAEFDLVILSVGIRPAAGNRGFADRMGLAVDSRGFFGIKNASAFADVQRAGVYVVGTCEAPRDIAACIAQAEAVSSTLLADFRS